MKPLFEYMVKDMKTPRGMVGQFKEIIDGDLKAVIKCFDEPSSEYGIDGGRISKLWIKNTATDTVVANYDRGWDVRPKGDKNLMKFYDRIIKEFN